MVKDTHLLCQTFRDEVRCCKCAIAGGEVGEVEFPVEFKSMYFLHEGTLNDLTLLLTDHVA